MSWNYSEKKFFNRKVEFSGLRGDEHLVGGVYCGDISGQEGWLIFGHCVRDSLHPPSRGNPVVHPKNVENFKPLIWLSPPRERWKFKIPQDLIKLSSYLPGGEVKFHVKDLSDKHLI